MSSVAAQLQCDYLVVGGGSAGCVLASRLSELGASVILIEAGEDTGGGLEPSAISDARFRSSGNPRFFWPGLLAKNSDSEAPPTPFPQARVLGGGSSINGMHCQRGLSSDYQEWQKLGAVGWSWDDVLPFFKRLERDLNFGEDDHHGNHGPLSICRVPENEWSQLSHAFADVMSDKGLPKLDDINDGLSGDGYGAVPLNIDGNKRLSTAKAYLGPEVRARSNLKILTNAEVLTLLTEAKQVIGTLFRADGHNQRVLARETIVCAGAIHSPALLRRSGIGPKEQLETAGIAPVLERSGVGQNLRNHPMLVTSVHLKTSARAKAQIAPPCPVIARYSSTAVGCPESDMMLNFWERVPTQQVSNPLMNQMANVMVILSKPYSQGSVGLTKSGTLAVNFNSLTDSRDMERVAASLLFIRDMLGDKRLSSLINKIFLPQFTPLAIVAMQNNWKAKCLSAAGAIGLSGPKFLRDKILKLSGVPLSDVLKDTKTTEDYIKRAVIPGGHPSGTCRMGDPSDPHAVVDSRCRVIGIEGLRVVDTSIFPTMMSGGTNLPVIMAAEKAAFMISEDFNI